MLHWVRFLQRIVVSNVVNTIASEQIYDTDVNISLTISPHLRSCITIMFAAAPVTGLSISSRTSKSME